MSVPNFSDLSDLSLREWCLFGKHIVVSSARGGVLDEVLRQMLPFFNRLVRYIMPVDSNRFDVIMSYILYLTDRDNYPSTSSFLWIFRRTLEVSRKFDEQNDAYMAIVLGMLTELLYHSFSSINGAVTFNDRTESYLIELLKECRLSPSFLLQLFEGIRGERVSDRNGDIIHHILLNVLSPSFPDQQVFAQVCIPLIRDQAFLTNYSDTLFVLVASIVNVMRSTPGVFLGLNPYFCCEQCLRIHLYKLLNSALEANPMYENRNLYEDLRNYLLQTIVLVENEREARRRQRRRQALEMMMLMYFPEQAPAPARAPASVDDATVERITSSFIDGCCQTDSGSFECAICQETNDGCDRERPGVVFPCESESKTSVLHIFCKPCLEKLVKTLAKSKKRCEDVPCPSCRKCMVASAASAASE